MRNTVGKKYHGRRKRRSESGERREVRGRENDGGTGGGGITNLRKSFKGKTEECSGG